MHCNIIPANIFRNIAEKGRDEQQRKMAVLSLQGLLNIAKLFSEQLSNPQAQTGNAKEFWGKKGGRDRVIVDAEHREEIPVKGKVVRREKDSSNGDEAADEAFDGAGKTYDFFKEIFGRSSIDNKGMTLRSNIHFGRDFANAFWYLDQMTYGDGDGFIFNKFTILDICAHEISHGVTEKTAGLEYYRQSGALNEHFSDVFGIMVKHWALKQTVGDSNWLLAEGLFNTDNVDAPALRSMSNPGECFDDEIIGRDRQVGHMDDYEDISFDNGGVHIFSGIFNRMFYNACKNMGDKTHSWQTMGPIWYRTLTTKLKRNSQFQDAANAFVAVAADMHGKGSTEQKAIAEACKVVGLTPRL